MLLIRLPLFWNKERVLWFVYLVMKNTYWILDAVESCMLGTRTSA